MLPPLASASFGGCCMLLLEAKWLAAWNQARGGRSVCVVCLAILISKVLLNNYKLSHKAGTEQKSIRISHSPPNHFLKRKQIQFSFLKNVNKHHSGLLPDLPENSGRRRWCWFLLHNTSFPQTTSGLSVDLHIFVWGILDWKIYYLWLWKDLI